MTGREQMPSEFVFIYTPLPSCKAAEAMAGALVARRLAACVNIYPGVRSVYEWKGEVHTDEEVVAFIKTRRERVPEVMEAAHQLHPYELPAFLVLPVLDGNEDYLAWVRAQTGA